MEELYGVTVQPVNCEQLKESDVKMILMNVLKEFPVQKLDFYIPKWMEILPDEHPLKMTAIEHARNILTNVDQMKDMKEEIFRADGNSRVSDIVVRKTEMADGTVSVEILMDYDCYYEVISEYTGIPVKDEYVLFHTLAKLSDMQGEYEKVKLALSQVRAKGYGIVMPDKSEIVLAEPELIKHGNKFGVKIHAQAPSINLIKAQIETEIAPIVGSEQQANDLISYIKNNEATEDGVWETNIFGKSVYELIQDGLNAKLVQIPADVRGKFRGTLTRIVNDGANGLICLIL